MTPQARLAAFAFLMVAAILAACGGGSHPHNNSYVGRDSHSTTFLEWTEDNHEITGQVQQFGTEPGDAFNASVGGIRNGNNVSFTYGPVTLTGTFNGDTLTLNIPSADGSLQVQVMDPGGVDDYNKNVAQLRAELQRKQARATADAQNNQNATAAALSRQAADARAGTATAVAESTTAAGSHQRAILASGVRYKILTPFPSSACDPPYTSYNEIVMSNHAFLFVSTLCVNLSNSAAMYQGRSAWFTMPDTGCPESAYPYEPYKDLNAEGPTICVDGTLAEDAYHLGE